MVSAGLTIGDVFFGQNTLLVFAQVTKQVAGEQDRVAPYLVPLALEVRHAVHDVEADLVRELVDL